MKIILLVLLAYNTTLKTDLSSIPSNETIPFLVDCALFHSLHAPLPPVLCAVDGTETQNNLNILDIFHYFQIFLVEYLFTCIRFRYFLGFQHSSVLISYVTLKNIFSNLFYDFKCNPCSLQESYRIQIKKKCIITLPQR